MYELWRTRQRNGEVEEAMKSAEYKSTSFHVDAETEFAEDKDERGLSHVDPHAAATAVAATTRKRKTGSKINHEIQLMRKQMSFPNFKPTTPHAANCSSCWRRCVFVPPPPG